MDKFKAFMSRLMYGRYGVDRLYTGLFILFLIIAVIDIFITNQLVSMMLSLLNFLIMAFMFYRVFSKKIYKRKREETVYLNILSKVKRPFTILKRRVKERKTHIYKKCPSCKTQLRFPRKKGTIMVTCPKCKNSFKVLIK
ncbi:MAG: hypothetical protein IJZ94_03485 [Clostridia bacterium]|nr:hypothetical protein [Clostridia bacterium]